MPILKLHLEDGVWTYINNIYYEFIINMLQESALYIMRPNSVYGNTAKIVGL